MFCAGQVIWISGDVLVPSYAFVSECLFLVIIYIHTIKHPKCKLMHQIAILHFRYTARCAGSFNVSSELGFRIGPRKPVPSLSWRNTGTEEITRDYSVRLTSREKVWQVCVSWQIQLCLLFYSPGISNSRRTLCQVTSQAKTAFSPNGCVGFVAKWECTTQTQLLLCKKLTFVRDNPTFFTVFEAQFASS